MSDSLSLPGGSRNWGAWQINCGSDFPFFPPVCSYFTPTRWLDGSRCLLFVRWETLCLLIGADEQVTRPTTWSPLLFRQSSRKLLFELGTKIMQGWGKTPWNIFETNSSPKASFKILELIFEKKYEEGRKYLWGICVVDMWPRQARPSPWGEPLSLINAFLLPSYRPCIWRSHTLCLVHGG